MSELHLLSQIACTLSNCSDIMLQRTIYKLGIKLPLSVSSRDTVADLIQDNWVDKIWYMFTKANAGENI